MFVAESHPLCMIQVKTHIMTSCNIVWLWFGYEYDLLLWSWLEQDRNIINSKSSQFKVTTCALLRANQQVLHIFLNTVAAVAAFIVYSVLISRCLQTCARTTTSCFWGSHSICSIRPSVCNPAHPSPRLLLSYSLYLLHKYSLDFSLNIAGTVFDKASQVLIEPGCPPTSSESWSKTCRCHPSRDDKVINSVSLQSSPTL